MTNIGTRKVHIFKGYPEKLRFLHFIAPKIPVKSVIDERINVYIV